LGGIPPRMGRETSTVEFGSTLREVRVGSAVVVVRWRPARVRRMEPAGTEVRRERS
jgi:hypothetical protein